MGLSKRVYNEYYGYVEVRDYNPGILELPNPLLLLYFQRNPDKAQEFMMKMHSDRDAILEEHRRTFDLANVPSDARDAAQKSVQATLTQEFQEAHGTEIFVEFYLRGFHLGALDKERIGENPPVVLGLYREALESLEVLTMKEKGDLGAVLAVMLKRGFYSSRIFRVLR